VTTAGRSEPKSSDAGKSVIPRASAPNERTEGGDTSLFGRGRELSVLRELIERVDAHGGVLLVEGEAGIGKSALLTAASVKARSRGYQVLTTTGVECETHLPFAGLHQLLQPVLADIGHLPGPQRRALKGAFGLVDAQAPALFLIALATLHLLSDSAVKTPILLIAEDAQWLDRPTTDSLTIVARRLEADPIVMLVAILDGYESPLSAVGLRRLRLEGLDDEAAGTLVDASAPDLHPAVRARVIQEAPRQPACSHGALSPVAERGRRPP